MQNRVRGINSWEKPSVQTVLMPFLRDTRLLPIPSYASAVQPHHGSVVKQGNAKMKFPTNELTKHCNTFHTTSSLQSQIWQCQKPWGSTELLGAAQKGFEMSWQKKKELPDKTCGPLYAAITMHRGINIKNTSMRLNLSTETRNCAFI